MEEVINRRLRKKRQTRPDGKNTRPSAGNKTCESSGWLWLIIKSTSFKQNYVEMLKYASGFLHVLSLRMNAHPPLLVPCSERRQAGEVGGRATPSPFLSVSGARGQLLREAWSCCPWLSRAPAVSWKTQWRSHACSRPRTGWTWNLKKRGLDKRSPGVYSVCLPVLIFEETLCVWRNGRETWHRCLKSIISDGRFLPRPELWLPRSHGLTLGL